MICWSRVSMPLSLFRGNVDAMGHPLMEHIVRIACVSMVFVLRPQLHLTPQVTMVADVQRRVSDSGFCVICVIRLIQVRLVKVTANRIFLGQNVKKYVMRIYLTITQMKYVKPCVPRVVLAIPAMVMEPATMENVNATNTITTTGVCNVPEPVPVHLYVLVMAPVHYLEITPDVFVRTGGTVHCAIYRVPVC